MLPFSRPQVGLFASGRLPFTLQWLSVRHVERGPLRNCACGTASQAGSENILTVLRTVEPLLPVFMIECWIVVHTDKETAAMPTGGSTVDTDGVSLLVTRAQTGDVAAFEQLLLRMHGPLRQYLNNLAGPRLPLYEFCEML